MEGDSPFGPKVLKVLKFDEPFRPEGCGGRLHGHALAGVRVQKVQRVQRFDTAFGREGCGRRLHGHALAGVRVKKVQRVQRFDGPMARGLWWAPVAPV